MWIFSREVNCYVVCGFSVVKLTVLRRVDSSVVKLTVICSVVFFNCC